MNKRETETRKETFWIVGPYVLIASAWILLSDRILAWMVTDPDLMARLQTYKGWGFVLVTGGLLHVVLRRRSEILKRVRGARQQVIERLKHYLAVSPAVTYALKVEDELVLPIWVSENIESLLGYTVEEALQPHWWVEHLHPLYREGAQANISALSEKGALVQEYRFLRKDGNAIWIRDNLRLMPNESGKPQEIVGVWTDITDRVQAEAKIQEQLQILSALYAGAKRVSDSLDLQARAREVVRTCGEVFGARLAWLGRAEPDGRVRVLTQYPQEIPYLSQLSVRWDDTPEGQGPTGRAIRSGFPEITQDISGDPQFAPWRKAALQAGFRSSGAFPLISRGHIFGVLNLYSDQPGFFSPERVKMLHSFAQQAAALLENARLFEETNRRLMRITALRNIDMAITGSLDLRVTFNVALDEIVNQLKIDAAAILRLDPHAQTLEYAAGRGFRTGAIEKTRLHLGEGHAGRAALERRIVQISNLPATGGDFVRAELLAGEDFVSYYAVPLIAKGHVVGVLEIYHRSPHEGNDEWLAFLETLAGQVAIAIDSASLFHDLERKHTELIRAYDATIEGWARALALKEEETQEHSRRVTELTVRIAKTLGMGDEEITHVRRGALLHDIGKIGVPDSILLKPGKPTEDEWAIIRQHPVYAFEMLSSIAYLSRAMDIPYCHHEKWDGTGYPRGLKGEEIPLAARIFAVVDVWDALVSDRPYRKAWPQEKVIEYIREQSGAHFDPGIIEQCLEALSHQ